MLFCYELSIKFLYTRHLTSIESILSYTRRIINLAKYKVGAKQNHSKTVFWTIHVNIAKFENKSRNPSKII